MALDVKWTIAKTELRFQEDSLCQFKITNAGKDPLKVGNPVMTPTLLELRFVDVKSGKEVIYQEPRLPGQRPPMEATLAPGKSFDHGGMLLDVPKRVAPGEYDVFAGCHYNNRSEKAESAPVRVKIRPTTPRNVVVEGVQNQVLYGAWINLGDDPSEVVRMEFDLATGLDARDLRPVGKAGIRSQPAISVPKNLEACPHHWIAWIEGTELKFAHVHEAQGPTPTKSLPVQAGEILLVAPLHSDPTPDDGGRPQGGALLWIGERDRADGQLISVKFASDTAGVLARAPLPGPKPAWIASFVRSDTRRLALAAQVAAGKISLVETPWPGTAGALRKLGEWKGELVGAGITLDGSDTLHGMLLLRPAPEQPLEKLVFAIDAKGVFKPEAPAKLAPEFRDPVNKVVIRVSGEGRGVALLQDPKGPWSFYDGEAVAPLGGPYAVNLVPFDVMFRESGEPMLIAGGKDLGLRLLQPNGQPPPHRH